MHLVSFRRMKLLIGQYKLTTLTVMLGTGVAPWPDFRIQAVPSRIATAHSERGVEVPAAEDEDHPVTHLGRIGAVWCWALGVR